VEGRINGLDLFSGIGGNTLALRPWVKTIAYCEASAYAQSVLISRIAEGLIEPAPIWDDVRTLTRSLLSAPIDIIIAGFPCQDISVAGNGAGLAGERSGLVFEVFRLISEIRPRFVFLENVPAIRTRGGERVGKELAALGYDSRWDMLSAFDVGAPHKRERWFLLGYANGAGPGGKLRDISSPDAGENRSKIQRKNTADLFGNAGELPRVFSNTKRVELRDEPGRRGGPRGQSAAVAGNHGQAQSMANAHHRGLEVGLPRQPRQCSAVIGKGWWEFEPDVGRVAHGVSDRVERIKCLGNAVVPAQAREAFKRLMGL